MDYPTPIMIIPAHDTPLYSQGKVSYFLIPMGERKLLNQFPKIACHSQLLGWSPSRGEQREYNLPAGCEWEATKTWARRGFSRRFCLLRNLYSFFCWAARGLPFSNFLFCLKGNQWVENETKHRHLLWGPLWCFRGFTLFGGIWIGLLASCDWSGEVFRWTECAFLFLTIRVFGEDSLLLSLEIGE